MSVDRIKALNKATPGMARVKAGNVLNDLLTKVNLLIQSLNSCLLSSAGLVIKAGSSAVVKAGAAFAAVVGGSVVRKAASTDMAALAGTLATAKSALWAFYIDSAGTLTTSTKTADAASHDAAIALLPALPDGVAQIGFVVIDNATGSNFVGGTTALDTASLTVTYYNTPGPIVNSLDAVNAAITTLANR